MGNKQSLRKGKWDTRLLQDKLGRNVKFHVTVVKPRRGVTKFRLKASVKATPHAPSYKIDKRISDENEVEMYLQAWAEQNNPDTGGFTNRLTSLTAKQVADAQQAVEILPTGTTLLQAAQLQKLTEKTSVYTCAQFFKSWYESNEKELEEEN